MAVPVDFHSVLSRCRRALSPYGKTLVLRGDTLADVSVFECELKHNGRVRYVPDLEKLARNLEVMESVEVPNSEWQAARQ
jgi:hypothetical protein